jgi:hypothetical protein
MSLLSPCTNHYFPHPVPIPRIVRSPRRRHLRSPNSHCSTRRRPKFRIPRPISSVGNQLSSAQLSDAHQSTRCLSATVAMAVRAAASAGDMQGGRCLVRRGFLSMHRVADVRCLVCPLHPYIVLFHRYTVPMNY